MTGIERLVAAVRDEDRMPKLHRKIMAKHRAEWPTLWAAIDQIIAEHDNPTRRQRFGSKF